MKIWRGSIWVSVVLLILLTACATAPPTGAVTARPTPPSSSAPPPTAPRETDHGVAARPSSPWQRTNPGGGGAFNVVGAGPTGMILVGSDLSGAYRSRDGGQTWDVIGATQGLTATHISGLGFHPTDPDIFYLGADGGLFRSDDGGDTVQQVLDGGYITDIAIAPGDGDVGYAAYHPQWDSNEGAVFRTEDSGWTWEKVSGSSLPEGRHILKLLVDPTDADVVYLLSGEGRFACGPAEAYRSTDGGVHWTELAGGLGQVIDLALDPTDPDTLYLTTYGDVWDEGYTCITDDPDGGRLYKSDDRGETWWELPTPDDAPINALLWLDADDDHALRLLSVDYPELWETTDDGESWTLLGDKSQWDTGWTGEDFAYGTSFNGDAKTLGWDPTDPDALLWVDSQFVWGTRDDGRSFVNLYTNALGDGWQSRGVDNIVPFGLTISAADPDDIYLGCFDIGCWRSTDGGLSWQNCNDPRAAETWAGNGGNTTTLIADPDLEDVVWTAQADSWDEPGTMLWSDDGGETWSIVGEGLLDAPLLGLALDVTSPPGDRTLFVTAQGDVYRSLDDGETWAMVFDCDGCRTTAVDRFDGDLVYAGGEGGLWRSTEGGDAGSWAAIGPPEMGGDVAGPPWEWGWEGVFSIAPDPHNSGTVYVAVLGEGRGLYRSRDRGDTWEKLLTDDYMRSVAISPQDGEILFAASSSAWTSGGYEPGSRGVLLSTDGGRSWSEVNEGMAWPFAISIAFDPQDPRTVFVGSPGTGFQRRTFAFDLQPQIYLPLSLQTALLPLPKGASRRTAERVTQHLRTNAWEVDRFWADRLRVEGEAGYGLVRVGSQPHRPGQSRRKRVD